MKLNKFKVCYSIVIILFLSQCINKKVNNNNKNSLFSFNKKLFQLEGKKKLFNFFLDNKTPPINLELTKSTPRFKDKGEQSEYSYWGWLRYIEIKEYDLDPPTSFIKNLVYQKEINENPYISLMSKDAYGYLNVPYEDMFYVVMTQYELIILSARDYKYKHIVKSISFSSIILQESMHPFKGGIEDVGNFSEGYCFMIKVEQIEKYILEFCSETLGEKENWMNMLGQIAIRPAPANSHNLNISNSKANQGAYNQHLTIIQPELSSPVAFNVPVSNQITAVEEIPPGYIIIGTWSTCSQPCGQGLQSRTLECVNESLCHGKRLQEKFCNIKACKEEVDSHMEKLKKVAEGKWEYLGSWSPCSKSCDGGFQTIKRKCISLSGCEGETVFTQPCNVSPCTESNSNGIVFTNDSSLFSRNVYDECKLLEGNLMLIINNERVLSHIEVTTQTVQIISKNNPRRPIVLPINKLTQVRNSFSAPGCFKLFDVNNQFTCLCPDSTQASADVWVSRILEFKNKCAQKALNDIQNDINKSLKASMNPNNTVTTLNNIQSNLMTESRFHSNLKGQILVNQFEEFKRQAKDILAKEDDYESRLEQAEKERITYDENKLKDELNREQTLAVKLLDDIQNISVNDSMYKIKEHSVKKEMKDMMSNLQLQVQMKRERLLNKLQQMRTMHELTKRKAAQEAIDMKRNLGQKISEMTKQGNPSQCFMNRDVSFYHSYCTTHYSDVDMQSECKNASQFCYMCCNIEVGTLNQEHLNCCYNKCDNLNKQTCNSFEQVYHIVSQQVVLIK